MEIKATLLKPFTSEEKMFFVFEQNHKNHFKIEEREEGLVALGLTKEEQAKQEIEDTAMLTMTALDFINFLRSCGIQLASIRSFLDSNLELDTQLKYCQNVYCYVAASIMPIEVDGITITAEMVRQAFINKAKGV